MISEEEWQRLCAHPQITTLPRSPDYLSGVACVICRKRCIIGYRDVFYDNHEKRDFCLAEKLKATFGNVWEEAAMETCSCARCKGKRGLA